MNQTHTTNNPPGRRAPTSATAARRLPQRTIRDNQHAIRHASVEWTKKCAFSLSAERKRSTALLFSSWRGGHEHVSARSVSWLPGFPSMHARRASVRSGRNAASHLPTGGADQGDLLVARSGATLSRRREATLSLVTVARPHRHFTDFPGRPMACCALAATSRHGDSVVWSSIGRWAALRQADCCSTRAGRPPV